MGGAWFRICRRYIVCATPPTVFRLILLKLYRWFNDGLKIRMGFFFKNPEISFALFSSPESKTPGELIG